MECAKNVTIGVLIVLLVACFAHGSSISIGGGSGDGNVTLEGGTAPRVCSGQISSADAEVQDLGACISSIGTSGTETQVTWVTNYWSGTPICTVTTGPTSTNITVRIVLLDNSSLDMQALDSSGTGLAAEKWFTCVGENGTA